MEAALVTERATPTPTPRAFHASWAFGTDIFVHGGEGSSGATSGNGGELDDVIGGVSRDPFAEEDGGAPLAKGRAVMVAGRVGTGCVVRSEHEHASGGGDGDGGEALRVQQRRQRRRGEGQGQKPAEKVCAAVVAVLEDLWKLNTCTMRWERVSRAHTSGAGGGGADT